MCMTEIATTKKAVGRQTHECPRCAGAGVIEIYRHVNGGICLLCGGSGRRPGPARKARTRKMTAGANDALWAEFAKTHPREAAIIWAGKDTSPVLGRAYSAVATFDPRDSNPAEALSLVRKVS